MSGLNESGDDGLDGIDEEALIEALKTKGLEDPETLEMLQQWTALAEAERDQFPTGPQAEEAGVDLEIRRATLYSKANLHADGEDLAQNAWLEALSLAEAIQEPPQKERLVAKVVQAAGQCGYRF